MKLLIACVALFIGVVEPVSAQEFEKDKAILKLLKVTDTQKMVSEIAKNTFSQLSRVLNKKHPNLTAEHKNIIREEVFKVYDEAAPVLTGHIAVIYGKIFSIKEIRDITAFYQTETGKKTLTLMPRIMQESMHVALKWARGTMPDLAQRIKSRMKKEGVKLDL